MINKRKFYVVFSLLIGITSLIKSEDSVDHKKMHDIISTTYRISEEGWLRRFEKKAGKSDIKEDNVTSASKILVDRFLRCLKNEDCERWYFLRSLKGFTPQEQEKLGDQLFQYYEKQENSINSLHIDPKVNPYGDMNYAMTLKEMEQIVKNKFDAMKQKGLIISKEEFEKIKKSYYIDNTHRDQLTDLTRIWGAKYLKEKINKSDKLHGQYDVPDYIIVADNPEKINVELWFGENFPTAGRLKNAKIFFKNIEGAPIGCNPSVFDDIGPRSAVGYADLSLDNSVWTARHCENVIKDTVSGINYIVDTESRSFLKLDLENPELARYASSRFSVLNNIPLTQWNPENGPLDCGDGFEVSVNLHGKDE